MKKKNIDNLIEQISSEADKLNNLLEVYPSFNQNTVQNYNNQLATNPNRPNTNKTITPADKDKKLENSLQKTQIELDKYKDIQSKRAEDSFNMSTQEVNNKIKELQGQQQYKIAQQEKGNVNA